MKEQNDKVTGIELSSNSLGYIAAKALSEAIHKLEKLEVVNYRDIFVGRLRADLPKSLFELVNVIHGKNIQVLDLSDNAFGPIGVQSFENFLKNTHSLKKLYLENNGLGPEGAEMVAESLISNETISLDVLAVNRNRLENKGALAFSKLLTKMQSLTEFQAFQNGIKEEGMAALLDSLSLNKELKIIKINDNLIKDAAVRLPEMLAQLNKLEIIDISDSLLGDNHAISFFKSLSVK